MKIACVSPGCGYPSEWRANKILYYSRTQILCKDPRSTAGRGTGVSDDKSETSIEKDMIVLHNGSRELALNELPIRPNDDKMN